MTRTQTLLTLSSLPPPIAPVAARTQRSLAAKAGTPEPDRGADLEPPPVEAVEPPDRHPPEQIRASTEVERPLESLRGKALWRAMGQMNSASVRALEGKTPIGEAHGRPPDFSDRQMEGTVVWEPAFVEPMADARPTQAQRIPV